MKALGARLASRWSAGDTVLFDGPLGAGKTTLIRGILRELGWQGPVRSPTFTLLNPYDIAPPVLHADLYRLESAAGIGLEEYLGESLCLIEWPDRLRGMINPESCTWVTIEVQENGRRVTVRPPTQPLG